jgi:Response regulators consisting of a CheY-like receiver domain and a winged-helix DNA-binding domain
MAKTVLLVEDEPNIIEAVGFILSRAGYEVKSHGDGATAIETVRRTRPDLVILDVMLPGKGGLDILRDLRAAGDLAATPVLMLTARGQKQDREQAERFGATGFMTKPFANGAVLDAVRAILGDAAGSHG